MDMSQQSNQSLKVLLEEEGLCVPQLLQLPNIVSRIKSQIEFFVSFCLSNDDFCYTLITLGLEIPIQSPALRNVAHSANQILTFENYYIAELFLPQTIINYDHPSLKSEPYIDLLLKSLEQEYIEDACIGYISKTLKIINTFKPIELLNQIKNHKQYQSILMNKMKYASISDFLICLICNEETEYERETVGVKNELMQKIVESMQENCSSQMHSMMMHFVEECFYRTYYQRNQQSIILKQYTNSHILSQSNTVFYVNKLVSYPQNNRLQVVNSAKFLYKVIERMNLQRKKDYIGPKEDNLPTFLLSYQIHHLFNKFQEVLSLCCQTNFHFVWSSLDIYQLYLLPYEMTKSDKMMSIPQEQSLNLATILLKSLKEYEANSMISNVIFHILISIMQKLKVEITNKMSHLIYYVPMKEQYKSMHEVLQIMLESPHPKLMKLYCKYLHKLDSNQTTNSNQSHCNELEMIRSICQQRINSINQFFQENHQLQSQSTHCDYRHFLFLLL